MNKYLLTIKNQKVRALLLKYPIHSSILENGYLVSANSEYEARKIAFHKYSFKVGIDIEPGKTRPIEPKIYKYLDIWLNPDYSSIEIIN